MVYYCERCFSVSIIILLHAWPIASAQLYHRPSKIAGLDQSLYTASLYLFQKRTPSLTSQQEQLLHFRSEVLIIFQDSEQQEYFAYLTAVDDDRLFALCDTGRHLAEADSEV